MNRSAITFRHLNVCESQKPERGWATLEWTIQSQTSLQIYCFFQRNVKDPNSYGLEKIQNPENDCTPGVIFSCGICVAEVDI